MLIEPEHIEPVAVEHAATRPTGAFSDTLTLSIAISLKRIADAMTETNEFGENTAEAVGGHIRRAMNDISATVHHTMSNRR